MPELGEYLLWEDEPMEIIGLSDEPEVILRPVGPDAPCPTCGELRRIHVRTDSLIWEQGAMPMPTIERPARLRPIEFTGNAGRLIDVAAQEEA